jgi:DNA-binding NtrC family response regulator
MRILIVEDDEALLDLLVTVFQLLHHQVVGVGTAVAAEEQLERGEVEVLLTDGNLPRVAGSPPGLYGPELLRIAERLGIPAVLLSGDKDLVDDLHRQGYQAFLKGVLDFEAIEAVLEEAEERTRLTEEWGGISPGTDSRP